MPVVVFRCDATAEIGGGHAMRCLTLANALAEAGWDCVFACRAETSTIVPQVAQHRQIVLGASYDLDSVRSGIDDCDLMVIDHYGYDTRFESACRGVARAILVIDDLADRPHDCDVLLDQTLGRAENDYRGLVASNVRMLLGPKFALLRPQFHAVRGEALRRRKVAAEAKRILISFGASDPHSLTLPIARALHDRGGNLVFDAIVGANVAEAPLDGLERVAWRRQVGDMASLMLQADLAVGAPGTTSWERCALGLPSVVVITAENQKLIAAELVRSGAAQEAGSWEAVDPQKLAISIERLAKDAEKLKAMSKAASEICDAAGTARVVDVLREITPGSFTGARRSA